MPDPIKPVVPMPELKRDEAPPMYCPGCGLKGGFSKDYRKVEYPCGGGYALGEGVWTKGTWLVGDACPTPSLLVLLGAVREAMTPEQRAEVAFHESGGEPVTGSDCADWLIEVLRKP